MESSFFTVRLWQLQKVVAAILTRTTRGERNSFLFSSFLPSSHTTLHTQRRYVTRGSGIFSPISKFFRNSKFESWQRGDTQRYVFNRQEVPNTRDKARRGSGSVLVPKLEREIRHEIVLEEKKIPRPTTLFLRVYSLLVLVTRQSYYSRKCRNSCNDKASNKVHMFIVVAVIQKSRNFHLCCCYYYIMIVCSADARPPRCSARPPLVLRASHHPHLLDHGTRISIETQASSRRSQVEQPARNSPKHEQHLNHQTPWLGWRMFASKRDKRRINRMIASRVHARWRCRCNSRKR